MSGHTCNVHSPEIHVHLPEKGSLVMVCFMGQVCSGSRPAGGPSRQALPQPDLPQPRQWQGVPAVAAIERDDPPTIRERVPRRLPVGRGNKTTSARQTRDDTLHTSRTAMFAGAAVRAARSHAATDDRRERAILSAHVSSPHERLSEAAALRAFGVLSEAAAVSGIGRFTHCAAIRARLSVRSHDHRPSLQPGLRPVQDRCIVIGTRAERRDAAGGGDIGFEPDR